MLFFIRKTVTGNRPAYLLRLEAGLVACLIINRFLSVMFSCKINNNL